MMSLGCSGILLISFKIHFLDLDDEAAEPLREKFMEASAKDATTSIPAEAKDQGIPS